MDYIYIGTIINTHGIKGELRIKSNFTFKDKAFIIGKYIYIGSNKEKHTITSYRTHKDYDMITLKDLDNINMVLKYKNEKVYSKRSDLFLNDNEFLEEDLIGYEVYYKDEYLGKVIEIFTSGLSNKVVRLEKKLFPYHQDIIDKIDKTNKKIYLKNKGVII